MADDQQSPRMRTRAQNRVTTAQPGVELIHITDGGNSGGADTEVQEKSSLSNTVTADNLSAQADTGSQNMYKPVLTITDNRIRTLLAQTNMEKMMLDNSIKDLNKQVERHLGYQADGEDSNFLIDRAIQLKKNVIKADQLEQSLLSKLSNLTSLLEMLNMEGDEEQKKRGAELSNKVTTEIEKYSGRMETFHHENRATLKFALPRQSTAPSSDNSQSSSRNSSVERRYSRIHDHLKPQSITWDDTLEVVSKFKEQFSIWIVEVTRMTGPDKLFTWNSLLSLLDHEWARRLKETKGLGEKNLEQIFQRMDDILMDRFPLIVRRMEYERLKKGSNELPSTFIERVFASSHQAQLDDAPLVSRVLVKIITSLGTDTLNKTVKDYLIKIMRENPNISEKDDIMTYIYAVESDETAKQAAEKKERVQQVEELIQCRVCDKRHKKKSCSYKCNHCGMLGSHKANSCWKAYPHLKG